MASSEQQSEESPLDQLPDEILEIVLGNLWMADRLRCRLVCKKWNGLLAPGNNVIPKAMEAPWQVLPDWASTNIRKKKFESLFEGKTYRLKFPAVYTWPSDDIRCHGFSGGWILVSLETYLYSTVLWNPVSGAIRLLPSLPGSFLDIRGVQVFSLSSVECIVAVLLNDEIVMCTPHVYKWTVFKVVLKKSSSVHPADRILFNTGDETLYVVCNEGAESSEAGRESYLTRLDEIRLRNCHVRVRSVLVRIPGVIRHFPQFVDRQVKFMRLVESSVTHEVLIVVSVLDPIVDAMNRRQETREFMVFSLSSREEKLVRMESIGEQTIFLGTSGSYSVRNVRGVSQDCIYFATGDARLRDSNGFSYAVGEVGVFSLKQKKMELNYVPYYYNPPGLLDFGWFTPQF